MSIRISVEPAVRGSIGVITLDRAKAINSLNLEMCQKMAETIRSWKDQPDISCIFIQGDGEKGFCAGGDVKAIREAIVKAKEDPVAFQYVVDFFCYEYLNDFQLHTVHKPIIVFSHGITMGGGIGVFAGGSYRIVSEKSLFAMPEISIGLYPDVGATYFLNKMPPGVGLFLALTGARFGPHDAMDLGLATHSLKESQRSELLTRLREIEWDHDSRINHSKVAGLLDQMKNPLRLRSTVSRLLGKFETLNRSESYEGYLSQLKEWAKENAWIAESVARLDAGSPLSARVIFEQIKRGTTLSLRDVFIREFDMSIQFSHRHDFSEGVRAVLVDKDNRGDWAYKTPTDVPSHLVEEHFADPFAGSTHPFKSLLEKFGI